MPSIGPLEIAIVLIVLLVIFGPKRLPELGRSAGAGFRELKSSIRGDDSEPDKETVKVEAERDDEEPPASPGASG